MHARYWIAGSVLLVAAVIYGSLSSSPALPVPGGFDKLEHFGAYFLLAIWFTGLVSRPLYWKVGLALAGLGLAMELLQYAMQSGRYGDPFDMGANALGIAAGVGVALWQTGGWASRIEAWLARS